MKPKSSQNQSRRLTARPNIPRLTGAKVTRLKFPSLFQENSEPPSVGSYFFSGLLSHRKGLQICLSATALAAGASLCSLPAMAQDTARMEKLEKENQELRRRLDALESVAQKEGILPKADATGLVKALSTINISGFVTASYFYNSTEPADRQGDGY